MGQFSVAEVGQFYIAADRIYPDRQSARADIFNYIEMFYNRRRKHGYNDMLSPVEYEKRYFMKLEGV